MGASNFFITGDGGTLELYVYMPLKIGENV